MSIALKPGRGSRGRGGGQVDGKRGEYWHVLEDGVRAGAVFVNWVADDRHLPPHASLQIFLNKNRQGRGIGRAAYRLAADASRYDTLYLHLRKSNEASRRAAEHAGFAVIDVPGDRQLTMRRLRR